MATIINRDLDGINRQIRTLQTNVNALTRQNRALDQSLKLNSDPVNTLNTRLDTTRRALNTATQRLELLRQKQVEYNRQLQAGEISQRQFDNLSTQIIRAENQVTRLNTELENTQGLINRLPAQKFEEIGQSVQNAGKSVENLGRQLRGASIAAAAALTSIAAVGLSTVKSADQIQTSADQIGISAEEFQRLSFIAQQTDVDVRQMTNAFSRARDAIGSQLQGQTNASTRALEKLGISAQNINNDVDGFQQIAIALSQVENGAVQASLANDIFGQRLGMQVLPFINAGENAIRNYNNQLDQIGILSNETVRELADFDNRLNVINSRFDQARLRLGVALIPLMERFATILENSVIPFVSRLAESFGNLSNGAQNAIIVILGILSVISPLTIAIGKTIQIIGVLISAIPKLIAGIKALNVASATTLITWGGLAASLGAALAIILNWSRLNAVQRVIAILGALTAAALSAAVAVGAFQSAWSLGAAAAGIVAGIGAVIAAIATARRAANDNSNLPDLSNINSNISTPQFDTSNIPALQMANQQQAQQQGQTINDNRNITINVTQQPGEDANALIDRINERLLDIRSARQ